MSGSRTRILVALVASVLLVLALSASAGASVPGKGTTTIIRAVGNYYSSPHWSPRLTRVAHGTTIEWLAVTNDHHIVAYGGNWMYNQPLPNGASVHRRFATSGTFLFRCSIHSTLANGVCQGMCGKIIVH
jgi:plastocyanin